MNIPMDRANDLRLKAIALSDEADRLKRTAKVLTSIANLSDAIYQVGETDKRRRCPGGGCKNCPAYVGHPGLCVFMRLENIMAQYYISRAGIEIEQKSPEAEAEVPE